MINKNNNNKNNNNKNNKINNNKNNNNIDNKDNNKGNKNITNNNTDNNTIITCKFCGKSHYKKYGFLGNKQKYKCKECGKVFVIGDNREKYSYDKKLKVIRMYLEGVGIRSIERLEHISTPLILKWIKGVSKIIKNKLINTEVPDKLENIEILEIDEITDIFKKKTKDFGYGLLLTETGIKLLIMRQVIEVNGHTINYTED